MATYRTVHLSFWTDPKVDDDFTPEDKYFYLYLLTNPHTNLCGCYEISMKQMVRETGYNEDTVKRLIQRMENVHNVIQYDPETKEILIPKWGKYNWFKSKDTMKGLSKTAEYVKSERLKAQLIALIEGDPLGGVYRPPIGGGGTSVSVLNNSTNTDIDNLTESCNEVIDYLNNVTGSQYKHSETSRKLIRARLKEGFTVDDCKKVILSRWKTWQGTEWQQYMRPDTLFRPSKFEGYLNAGDQPQTQAQTHNRYSNLQRLMEANQGE